MLDAALYGEVQWRFWSDFQLDARSEFRLYLLLVVCCTSRIHSLLNTFLKLSSGRS